MIGLSVWSYSLTPKPDLLELTLGNNGYSLCYSLTPKPDLLEYILSSYPQKKLLQLDAKT